MLTRINSRLSLEQNLANRECLTVTRESSNERRVENTGLNNLFNIFKVTKLDEVIIFLRNQVLFYSRLLMVVDMYVRVSLEL